MRTIMVIMLCAAMLCTAFYPADAGITADQLPTLLGSTNAGNEFYFSFPPCYEEESFGGDNSVRVYIASSIRQDVRVEVLSQGFVLNKVVPANGVIEFRIPTTVGQPFMKKGKDLAPPENVYIGAAIHVKSKAPIVVYGMTRYQYTSDGFLALPVSVLGQEYIVAAWPQLASGGGNNGYHLASLTTISAAYDNTQMTFEMGGNKMSLTTGGLKPGQSTTFKMMKGDVVCFSAAGNNQDISGSYIKADKPVAVVSGNQCANVPVGVVWCDFTSDMEIPIKAWGIEYHVTPIANRQNMPVTRIFAKEKDTKIYVDGKYWATITRETHLQESGFLEFRPPNDSATGKPWPVVISSEPGKPIYVMLYNTGQADDNVPSDPFQFVLTPLEQYPREIVFSTPGAQGGTLPFTVDYINLVYELTSTNTIPDDCEIGTVVNGKYVWNPITNKFGSSPGQIFKVPVRGRTYAYKRLDLPGNGQYRIRARTPFGAYSYGFSSYDSYGYSSGTRVADLTKNDTIPPKPEWTMLSNGSVNSATVEDLPTDVTMRSNLSMIYMDPDPEASFNYTFSFDKNNSFISGQTSITDWKLTVDDPTQDAQATLFFFDCGGNSTKLEITFSPRHVSVTPSLLDFGIVKSDRPAVKSVLLSNTTDTIKTITRMQFKDGAQGFSLINAPLPIKLNPGESKIIEIKLQSNTEGNPVDMLGIGDDNLFTYLTTTTARVLSPIIEVSNINFPTTPTQQKTIQKLNLHNLGQVDLVVTGYTPPKSPSIFNLVNWPQITAQNPLILKPDEIKSLEVEFAPDKDFTWRDSIEFECDASFGGTFRDNVAILFGRASTTGIKDIEETTFEITPNPATDGFTVHYGKPAIVTVRDVLGRIRSHRYEITGNGGVGVSTTDLPAGIYFVELLESSGKHATGKVVISR